MTERTQDTTDLAGILARGFELDVEDHGPDGSYASRREDGERYLVVATKQGGAASFVVYRGQRYMVNVVPIGDARFNWWLRDTLERSEENTP